MIALFNSERHAQNEQPEEATMIHLHNAHEYLTETTPVLVAGYSKHEYISVDGNSVTITIQDGPIGDVGVNGIQVTDMLGFVKEVYVSLNKAFPCRENSLTITKIEEAIHWQDARTKDRESRGVEGKNKE